MLHPLILFALLSLVLIAGSSISQPDAYHDDAQHSPSQTLLNSERIKNTFGSYGIDILLAADNLRISNLYSVHEQHKITRTLAIVNFAVIDHPAIQKVHQQVLEGASLGTAFKTAGWKINKKTASIIELPIDTKFKQLYDMMNLNKYQLLVAHTYDLSVSSDQNHQYASITEIHNPEYLTGQDLNNIYGVATTPVSPGDIEHLMLALEQLILTR